MSLLTCSTSVQLQPQGRPIIVLQWINPQKPRDDRRLQLLLDDGVPVCVTPQLLWMKKKANSESSSAVAGYLKTADLLEQMT